MPVGYFYYVWEIENCVHRIFTSLRVGILSSADRS